MSKIAEKNSTPNFGLSIFIVKSYILFFFPENELKMFVSSSEDVLMVLRFVVSKWFTSHIHFVECVNLFICYEVDLFITYL